MLGRSDARRRDRPKTGRGARPWAAGSLGEVCIDSQEAHEPDKGAENVEACAGSSPQKAAREGRRSSGRNPTRTRAHVGISRRVRGCVKSLGWGGGGRRRRADR